MQTLVAEILAAWRRAERLAAALEDGSPDHEAAMVARDRLRELYHELTRNVVAETMTEANARPRDLSSTD